MGSRRVLASLCVLYSRTGSLVRNIYSPAVGCKAENVVVVHKTSRLDFEKMKRPDLSDNDMALMFADGGVDYNHLRERHAMHTQSLTEIHSYLKSQGCSVRMRNRESFSEDDVHWAHLVIAAGGDGNFLFTASKVLSPDKLVVGLNTDPYKSEGYLCLQSGLSHPETGPSRAETSSSGSKTGSSGSKTGSSGYLSDQLLGIFSGQYSELRRRRIRVTLGSQRLPVLALNEVFVGERDISHSSYYEFSHDGGVSERQKSSGLLVYTGSGSTSWAYNMNKVSSETVQRLLQISSELGHHPPEGLTNPQLAKKVSEEYNASNVFGGEDERMAFTVREPIARGLFAVGSTHGYAKRVKVVSRSWNANLVLDGHYTTDFPNGSSTLLEIHTSDSLRTLHTPHHPHTSHCSPPTPIAHT